MTKEPVFWTLHFFFFAKIIFQGRLNFILEVIILVITEHTHLFIFSICAAEMSTIYLFFVGESNWKKIQSLVYSYILFSLPFIKIIFNHVFPESFQVLIFQKSHLSLL